MATLDLAPPKALVIHCGDPRFQRAFREFLKDELGLDDGDYIPLVIPGSIGGLGVTSLPKNAKVLGEQIGLYMEHNPRLRIIVINHEDCKWYASLMDKIGTFVRVHVHDKQVDDLKLSVGIIGDIARRLGHAASFELYMARIGESNEVKIEEVSKEDS